MTPDTLAIKRTALLTKAADLARSQAETAGAIAVLDELLLEAVQDAEIEEIRGGMESVRRPLHPRFDNALHYCGGQDMPVILSTNLQTGERVQVSGLSRDDRAELERHAEHKEACSAPKAGMTPPPPHRMVPRDQSGERA